MIRKFARINVPIPMLIELFAESRRWPHWMAGIEQARVVRSSDDAEIVDLELQTLGRRFEQRIECRVSGSTVRMSQISGMLKKWESTWRFAPAPGDAGTTVSLELDFDLGIIALMVPARRVQDEIDRVFDDTIEGARRELRARTRAQETGTETAGETLVEVYETRTGFEVLVAGRRFEVGKTR